MDWLPMVTDEDIAAFLADVAGFHDGYLRAVHVVFGSGDPRTSPYEDDRQKASGRLSIDSPSGPHGRMRLIELRFDEVVACHVRPSGPDFDPTVLEAEIVRRGDIYYWCLAESLIGGTDSTWMGGRRLSWRIGDA
jgi:hypothetical protein